MRIRKYLPSDCEAVESIHFETGFIGNSMSALLTDNNVWKSRIDYYLDKQADTVFVLEDEVVVGYLAGSLDDHMPRFSVFFQTLVEIAKGFPLSKKDRAFWLGQVGVMARAALGISKERYFNIPRHAGHLHINLLPKYRDQKWGSKMLAEFEGYAASKGVRIIHADTFQTRLNPTANFWLKNGFKEYSRVNTSYWQKQLPTERIDLVCYVKELPYSKLRDDPKAT